jgi:hypothetical protein
LFTSSRCLATAKVDPSTHLLWALQNEEANVNLVVIDPETHHQKLYTFSSAAHGGGYDDFVFRGCRAYISTSNQANNPNAGPAIVRAKLEGSTVEATPVLLGNASAMDIPTDATVQLNPQDPDSMTLDPEGNIVLDSQGGQELIIVSNPGAPNQRVLHLPLSYVSAKGATPVAVDEHGLCHLNRGLYSFRRQEIEHRLFFRKERLRAWCCLHCGGWGPFVGTIDMTTSVSTPIVTGFGKSGWPRIRRYLETRRERLSPRRSRVLRRVTETPANTACTGLFLNEEWRLRV